MGVIMPVDQKALYILFPMMSNIDLVPIAMSLVSGITKHAFS